MDWTRNSTGVRIVAHVIRILDDLAEYLPLTLRQIHYQLVALNVPDYANTDTKYKQLSAWLYGARSDGVIPWEAMAARSRIYPVIQIRRSIFAATSMRSSATTPAT